MNQPLFLVPDVSFDKVATGETTLSGDPNGWPTEILQEFYSQFPAASDFEPQVTMDKVDGERGFGMGHIELGNRTEIQHDASPAGETAAGVKKVRVPIIIKDMKLLPLDLMVTAEDKLLPLTENRLRSTIFRPQAFDITGKGPGDQSLIGQLYPPYRQNYGFGGGGASMSVGMGKEGSALEQYLEELNKEAKVKGCTAADTVGEVVGKVKKNKSLSHRVDRVVGKHLGKVVAGGAALAYAGNKAVDHVIRRHEHKQLAQELKTGSVLSAILPTISESDYALFFGKLANDHGLQRQLVANGHSTGDSIKKLAEFTPESAEKTAAAMLDGITPDVVQLRKTDDGYLMKSAASSCWLPREQLLDRGEAYRLLGAKVVLAADTTGTATMTTGPQVDAAGPVAEGAPPAAAPPTGQPVGEAESPEEDQPQPITTFGMYKVQDDKGRHLVGYVFPNLIDIDGTALPIALFTNGSQYAVQGDIVGIHAGHGGSIFEGTPSGSGCFYHVLANGKAEATIPFTIQGTVNDAGNGAELHCVTFDGREVLVVVQPNIQKVTMSPGGDHLLIPDSFCWLPLDKAEDTKLVETADGFGKEAQARRTLATVTVRGEGGEFSLSGFPLDKLASEDKTFLSLDDTMFLLGALGVKTAYAEKKLGEAVYHRAPVDIRVAHHIQPAMEKAARIAEKMAGDLAPLNQVASYLNRDLVKEAAVIPDPTAVDTVLSLGFLNAENLGIFVGYLPKIDESQEKICELLLAARLGLRNIPIPALEKAMRTVEEVLEGLKQLAFVQG